MEIPWIAVSDFLLSGLCDEVGQELYEMSGDTRKALLDLLEQNGSFGRSRVQQLAQFLEIHVKPKLQSDDPDMRDWAEAQRWTALAYYKPEVAARELITALSNAYKSDQANLIRLTTLVTSLDSQFTAFQELLLLAQGMAAYTHGDLEKAEVKFQAIKRSGSQRSVPVTYLPKLQIVVRKKAFRNQIFLKGIQKTWPILLTLSVTLVFAEFGFRDLKQSLEGSVFSTEGTLVFFQTDSYAVRVLDHGTEGLIMNVFNQRTGIQEQNGVLATALPRRDGEPLSYLSSS
ncbi:MAG: hypothetical protein ACTS3T_22380, partial [Almyronema sp.]